MKIAIVGPGALGCLLAGYIAHRSKCKVWLIDHLKDRAARLSKAGITVDGISSAFTEQVPVVVEPSGVGAVDFILICVKGYSTEEACKEVKGLVGASTHIVTLQNGLGHTQILNDNFGAERVIGGITSHGATLVSPGHVRHAGRGETVLGRADGRVLGPVREIADILTRSGFETKVSKDIDSALWGKLAINVGINALAAITRLNNGELVEHDTSRDIMRRAVQEAVKIAKRKRIKLGYDDPLQKVESVCKATQSNTSSMLQDVLNGKRTEIDFINGAVVRQGKALGISTPINETLYALVKTIELTSDGGRAKK